MTTGVPEVDSQHKELFRQLALLTDAMKNGQGRTKIEEILDFLGDYVLQHFAAEEKHMDEMACPAAAANKLAHGEFCATFKKFRQRFDEVGAQSSLVLEICDTLSKWLVEHIGKIDTQLATCHATA